MLKKLLWIVMLFIILMVSLVVSLYWFSPQISRLAITHWLEQQGFDSVEFHMQPPTDRGLRINQLALSQADGQRHIQVRADSLELRFNLAQIIQQQRLELISAEQVDVVITIDTSLPERLETLQQEEIDLHPQQLSELFASIPVDQLVVNQLNIRYQADASPELATQGKVILNNHGLESSWMMSINHTRLVDLNFDLYRDGSLNVRLRQLEKDLLNIAGELSFVDEQWQLSLGHQLFSQNIIDWLNSSFSLSIASDLGLQDPLSFTAQVRLPRNLPLDPVNLLDSLEGGVTLATRFQPPQTEPLPYQLTINLLTQLTLQQRQISGQLQFSSTDASGQLPNTHINSQVRVAGSLDSVALNGHLSLADLNQLVSFTTEIQAGKPTHINWRLAERDAIPLFNQVRSYLEGLPDNVNLETGRFSASGRVNINTHTDTKTWTVTAQTLLSNATVLQANNRFERVDWNGQLNIDQTGNWNNSGDIALNRLNIGLPVTLSPIRYQLSNQSGSLHLNLSAFTASLLGGRIYFPALSFDPLAPDLIFLVSLREFDLGSILDLYADKGLYGEGTIDGQLPVRFNTEGLSIDGGNIGTIAPGVIRYQPDVGLQSMAQTNIGLRLAFEALSDLQYQLLDLGVHYQPNGDLTLTSRLQGSNPEWQQGRPIDLTLTIEDNIPDLLRALQITGRITDAIDQHFQRSP
ncbi:intermembrane phospholipid transport protein YdbH family protein [Nitrincola schmidtii]|uniref:intermembrane phospholipid transport protein YdbH family protein n=1 Tax=Nitrincola schmidtii TaxID=1730894 RepID=UPI00124CE840|nr:YdbH domain-containing protein [Nitrincola schmidtii]